MSNEFKRICSECGVDIYYTTKGSMNQAEKLNRKCKKCGCGWARGYTKETNESLAKMAKSVSISNKGCIPWNTGLTKEDNDILKSISEKNKKYRHTDKAKRLISYHSKLRWEMGVYDSQYSENYTEFKKYQNKVHKLTSKVKHLIEGYDENIHGKMGVDGAYQIDHIIDIKYGFDNNISEEVIADLSNLQFIPWEDNLKKGYYGKSKS
jgi:ribosomal protein L33